LETADDIEVCVRLRVGEMLRDLDFDDLLA
jgi:hypothetical protein